LLKHIVKSPSFVHCRLSKVECLFLADEIKAIDLKKSGPWLWNRLLKIVVDNLSKAESEPGV